MRAHRSWQPRLAERRGRTAELASDISETGVECRATLVAAARRDTLPQLFQCYSILIVCFEFELSIESLRLVVITTTILNIPCENECLTKLSPTFGGFDLPIVSRELVKGPRESFETTTRLPLLWEVFQHCAVEVARSGEVAATFMSLRFLEGLPRVPNHQKALVAVLEGSASRFTLSIRLERRGEIPRVLEITTTIIMLSRLLKLTFHASELFCRALRFRLGATLEAIACS